MSSIGNFCVGSPSPNSPRTYADQLKHPERVQSGYVVVPTDFLR